MYHEDNCKVTIYLLIMHTLHVWSRAEFFTAPPEDMSQHLTVFKQSPYTTWK